MNSALRRISVLLLLVYRSAEETFEAGMIYYRFLLDGRYIQHPMNFRYQAGVFPDARSFHDHRWCHLWVAITTTRSRHTVNSFKNKNQSKPSQLQIHIFSGMRQYTFNTPCIIFLVPLKIFSWKNLHFKLLSFFWSHKILGFISRWSFWCRKNLQ